MHDRLKLVIQTKRDTLVLQVGGWTWGCVLHPVKAIIVEMLLTIAAGHNTTVAPRVVGGDEKGTQCLGI
jgi:hypothetical protein